ncbi:MAG: hypothetical protein WCG26_05865 [Chloroflexales bacterium]
MAINTYAFAADAANKTNIAERTSTYGTVADGSARDARARAAALASYERTEIARAHRQNAGRVSSFWSAPAAPAAPPAA